MIKSHFKSLTFIVFLLLCSGSALAEHRYAKLPDKYYDYLHSVPLAGRCSNPPLLTVTGDMVLVSQVDEQHVASMVLTEDLTDYDASYQHTIYMTEQLYQQLRTDSFSSRKLTTSQPLADGGLRDYLYFLPGSDFSYQICLSTAGKEPLTSNIYLFNQESHYLAYLENPQQGPSLAYRSTPVTIGANNQSVCNSFSDSAFEITQPGYYWLMTDIPAQVTFQFGYYANVYYLDPRDYQGQNVCSLDEQTGCILMFSGDSSGYVLDHIQTTPAESPPTSHLCVTETRRE